MKRFVHILIFLMPLTALTTLEQETVAVLPFTATENGQPNEQLGKEAQQYLITYFTKKQKHLKVVPMNARDVNVKLHKAGITPQNLDDFTTKEIAEAVGADYILLGTIDKSVQGTSSVNTGYATTTGNKSAVGVSSGNTQKQYHASVYISIFSKEGKSLYDGNKANVFIDNTADSWKNSIVYMVRHFPFYQ